jgi:hypothetical protein
MCLCYSSFWFLVDLSWGFPTVRFPYDSPSLSAQPHGCSSTWDHMVCKLLEALHGYTHFWCLMSPMLLARIRHPDSLYLCCSIMFRRYQANVWSAVSPVPIVDPRRLLMGCVLPDLTPRMTATIPNLYLKFCVYVPNWDDVEHVWTCHNGIMALWPANGWFQSGESCGGPTSGRQPSTWSHDKTLVPASHLSLYPKNEPNRPKWTILWN